jgi:hypothetical protein
MRELTWAIIVMAGVLAGMAPKLAAAQPVLLVRPQQDDPVLLDAFHRLDAELHIHHFETQRVELDLSHEPSVLLATLAEQHHALAAIAFLQRNGQTALDVWLVDRVTGKTSMRTLEFGRGAEAANLIAVRAVDLLRASLGEFGAATPPKEIVGATHDPRPAAVSELTAAAPAHYWLCAEALLLHTGSRFGLAYGPALGLQYGPTPWLRMAVWLAGPLAGAELQTPSGAATLHQELAWLEAQFVFARAGGLQLAALLGAGGYFVQASGRANAPLISVSDQQWSWLTSLGARAELDVVGSVSASLSLRAFAILPRVGIAVATDAARIMLPAVEASLGIAVGL